MITKSKVASAFLGSAALVVLAGTAHAKDPVAAQANKVAAEAKDLQAATNKLDAVVANEQGNTATANAGNQNQTYARDDGDRHDRDDDLGKWGLLGLLGLAGLLGLKRRDHDHVRVDRRDGPGASPIDTTSRSGRGTTDTRL